MRKYALVIKLLLAICTVFIPAGIIRGQPFAEDIAEFRKQDSLKFPAKHSILFLGSSSITMWKDVQNYFPGYPIINRGFGGSTLLDIVHYASDIIFPYQPKQIVIYCGENDLAASDTVTARMVKERFITLFTIIRNKLPRVALVYISMKPSPSRDYLKEKLIAANAAIKIFLRQEKNTAFVNVYDKMINTDGSPIANLFLEDKLHMNKKGYAIWQKAIKPYLLK